MDKQVVQAGESWWQNSSRSTSKKQNETEIWIDKDDFKAGVIARPVGPRLDQKIVETFVINC